MTFAVLLWHLKCEKISKISKRSQKFSLVYARSGQTNPGKLEQPCWVIELFLIKDCWKRTLEIYHDASLWREQKRYSDTLFHNCVQCSIQTCFQSIFCAAPFKRDWCDPYFIVLVMQCEKQKLGTFV